MNKRPAELRPLPAWVGAGITATTILLAGSGGHALAVEAGNDGAAAGSAAVTGRLRTAVEWLAAPDREGRGPGTQGIDQAADWVAEQLAAIGLDTTLVGAG
ncbi:MAG: hypothetical protein WCH77_10740, partial [Planctomycetota bacterium]